MSEKNYKELKKMLDLKKFENLYFLEGDSDLVNYFENKILLEVLENNKNEFNFQEFKGENFSREKIEDAINTLPMMTKSKCILIKDIPWEILTNDDQKNLLEIFSDIPSFCKVIISQISPVVGTKHTAKLTKLKNFIKKNGVFSNLSQNDFPMEKQILTWSKRDYGKNMLPSQAKQILSLCKGYQIHEIKNEVKKICEFEKTDAITQESIDILWKPSSKINIFEISKALTSGNSKKSFEIALKLLEQNEDPIFILNVIAIEYIDIYRAKLFLEQNKDPMELANIFDYKKKEFRIKNAQKIAKNLKMKDIKEIILCLAKADMQLKTCSFLAKTIIFETIQFILNKTSRT